MAGINRNKHHYLLSWYFQHRICAEIWLCFTKSQWDWLSAVLVGLGWREPWPARGFSPPSVLNSVIGTSLECADWPKVFWASPIGSECVCAGNVEHQEKDDVIMVLSEGKHNVPFLARVPKLRTLFCCSFDSHL